MTLWNKVSPAFSYLNDVRSGADNGQVGVSSAKYKYSLQIFTVGVPIRRCSWLFFCCGDFDLFFRSVLRQDLVSSTLYFGGEGLQACLAWGVPAADVLSAVARSRCKQRVVFAVFKALCGDDVCMCSFFLLPFQCVFQAPIDDEQSVEEDDQRALRCNFIFFMSFCVKLFSFCNTNCFT